MTTRIGIDIGGTFTDLVFLDPDGRVLRAKVLSTPDDYSQGIAEGLAQAMRAGEVGADARTRDRVVPLRLLALEVAQPPPRLGRDVGALVRPLRDLDIARARPRRDAAPIVADPVVEQCLEVVAPDARAHARKRMCACGGGQESQ